LAVRNPAQNEHQAERPEKIQRPGDRTGDENRGQEALRDARGV